MRKLICAFILFAFSWLLALTGFVCKIKADTSYEITFIEWLPDLRIKYTAEAFHTYSTIFYILARGIPIGRGRSGDIRIDQT